MVNAATDPGALAATFAQNQDPMAMMQPAQPGMPDIAALQAFIASPEGQAFIKQQLAMAMKNQPAPTKSPRTPAKKKGN